MADEEPKVDAVETPPATTPTGEKEPPRSSSTEWAAMTSWFNTAKQKAMETVDLVKKDLSELKDTMATEVSEISSAAKEGVGSAVSAISTQLEHLGLSQDEEEQSNATKEEKIKTPTENKHENVERIPSGPGFGSWLPKTNLDTVTNFLDSAVTNLQKAFTIVPDDEDEFTEAIKPRMGRNTRITKDQLRKIQTDENIYLNDPADKKTFDKWVMSYSFTEHEGEAHMLLKNNKTLSDMYEKLITNGKVTDADFWTRYFYAVEIAELNEEINASLSDKTISTQPVTEQPTSPAKSTDDWSICSEKNEIEEVSSNKSSEESESNPGTPQPPVETEEKIEKEKKEGDWVDWDE